MSASNIPIKFDGPASYQVVVKGHLEKVLHPYFDHLRAVLKKDAENTSINVYVKDQAALAGLINMLYEMHYPIILVKYLAEE